MASESTPGPRGYDEPGDSGNPGRRENSGDPNSCGPKDSRGPEHTGRPGESEAAHGSSGYGEPRRPGSPEDSRDPEDTGRPREPEGTYSSYSSYSHGELGSPRRPENSPRPEHPDGSGDAGCPSKPEGTHSPQDHGTPNAPSSPGKPQNSHNPEHPDGPENPGHPSKPEGTHSPQDHGTPNAPSSPGKPQNSHNPEHPDGPENPGRPSKPEGTHSPHDHGTPSHPHNPQNSPSPENSGAPATTPGEPTSPTATPAHAMARLSEVLAAAAQAAGAGPEAMPTPRELAELVWLARQLEEAERVANAGETDGAEEAGAPAGRQEPRAAEPPGPGPAARQPGAPRVPLHLPDSARQSSVPHPATAPASPPVLAPAPPMLHHPLALQRALRPLKRKVPAPDARLLDERATADRIARLGADPDVWLPVLRPARDRWLRLALVHDTGPTMPVWRPLVRELHATLAQSGIFRTVTLHPATPDGRARQVPVPADGRTAALVVSDCMGPQWRPGPAGTLWYSTLRHWASRMPLAVVQPLPEHLWDTTALPAEPGLLSPPAAAAPTAALTFTPYDPDLAPPPRTAVPLPVLEPGAPWLANWASLLADPGGGRLPGAAAWLPTAPQGPAEFAPDLAAASAQELVLRFRATASPEAFRLAGHLALAVPSVPVMRLVQRTVDRDPRPQHLAEIILSGMLAALPGPPGSYEFRPGVRELLLRTLPRSVRGRTREFLARVGGLIDERAGLAAGEFRARTGGDDAFATVREETVRRLGGEAAEVVPGPDADGGSQLFAGRYRLEGRRGLGRRVRQAVDTRTGERVIVHLYPKQEIPTRRFLREAEALKGIEDPHVSRVLDSGFDGETPYLVAEFDEGVTLNELLHGSGPGVTFPVFARLVCDVTAGLETLHAHGLVRGHRGGDRLLLRPDGTVMISRVTLGEESEGKDAETDVRGFNRMVRELAEHVSAPPGYDGLLDAIRDGRVPASLPDRLTHARDTDPLRIEMLGPLSISRPGHPLDTPSPEAQALLCMLAFRQGRRTSYADLAAGLWERPPGEAEFTRRIDTLARELARVLGPGTVAALPEGYALHAPGLYIDAVDFEDALRSSSDRKPGERHHLFRSALALFHGDPLDGVPGPAAEATRARLRGLHADIQAARAPADRSTTLRIATDADLSTRPESRITLEYAVHQVLSRGALTPQQYEIRVRPDGYVVHIAPDATLLPVLVAALRWLPGHWATLPAAPRLGVVFEFDQPVGDTTAPVTVVVPPSLYGAFTASSAASGPHRFHPLYGDSPDSPAAWYWPGPEDGRRDLLKGPSVTRNLGRLGIPAPGRTAIVHTRPEGPLTLLNPAGLHSDPVTYYEVDLTPHRTTCRLTLPSSGKGDFTAAVELSWRVTDPVAYVRGETVDVAGRLLAHLAEAAPRITCRHPQRRVAAAQRALGAELGKWPVPGLAVACAITLAPEHAPPPEVRRSDPAPRRPAELLAEAGTVLFGFDGPMVRLFTAATARHAALKLMALAVELRDPQDALTGRPMAVAAARESLVHPLDVLRVFARDPMGPHLRRRLDELEVLAVPDAPATHNALPLIRALHGSGRRVSVATDVCERAVRRYLEPYGRLPLSGVHGRADDLNLLMPNPDCLRRALAEAAGPAVLIGTTVAELSAAQRLGLPFIGLARNPTVEQGLRAAGCEVTVRSLAPLLEAARGL